MISRLAELLSTPTHVFTSQTNFCELLYFPIHFSLSPNFYLFRHSHWPDWKSVTGQWEWESFINFIVVAHATFLTLHFHHQLIKIFKNFLKNLSTFLKILWLFFKFFVNFNQVFLKFIQNIDLGYFYLVSIL